MTPKDFGMDDVNSPCDLLWKECREAVMANDTQRQGDVMSATMNLLGHMFLLASGGSEAKFRMMMEFFDKKTTKLLKEKIREYEEFVAKGGVISDL